MLLRTAKLNDSFVKARHNTEATPVNEGTKKSQPDRKKLVKKKRRENETSWRNVWNTMTDSTVNHKHYKRYTADYTWTTEQQETNRFGQETDQENELRNDKKTVSEFSTTAQKKNELLLSRLNSKLIEKGHLQTDDETWQKSSPKIDKNGDGDRRSSSRIVSKTP